MHFEFMGTPADAIEMAKRAMGELAPQRSKSA
jgi:hypothetical protein